MALYIGNPTNVIVSEAYNISFITYSAWMLLPTVVCILLAYVILRVLFRGGYYLPRHIQPPDADPKSVLIDPKGAIFGLVLLACCLGTLVGTSFARIPVWMVTLPFACVMFLRDVYHDLGISFSHLFPIRRKYPRPVLHTANHDDMLVYGTDNNSACHDIQLNILNMPSSNVVHDNNELASSLTIDTVPDQADLGTIPLSDNNNRKDNHKDKTTLRGRHFRSLLVSLHAQTSSTTAAPLDTGETSETITSLIVSTKKSKNKYLLPFYCACHWFGTHFHTVKVVVMRMPWTILPFSIGMFILIEALSESGWIGIFATAMAVFTKNYVTAVLGMVFVSILACQLLNNLVSRYLISTQCSLYANSPLCICSQ